jgi:hypothetical protein
MARLDLTDSILDDMAAQTTSTLNRYSKVPSARREDATERRADVPGDDFDPASMSTEDLIKLRDSM